MVMNCDDDYVNKPEKYKYLGNTIDGNIFNKHNDQEKKTLVKRILFTCMEFIQFKPSSIYQFLLNPATFYGMPVSSEIVKPVMYPTVTSARSCNNVGHLF
jgi:hypothetical protein